MKQVYLKLIGILSCLMILATLPVLAQNEINKKPLQDFAANLNQKLDKGEVDLDKPFSVTLEGYLTKDGKFDTKRIRFTKSEGDMQMVAVAKQAIKAIGDSRLLSYLRDLEIEKVILVLSQDETNLSSVITSNLPSENKARAIASGFNLSIQLAQENQKDDDVKTLLKAAKITTEGKNFIINFALPKSEVNRLLKNRTSKGEAKKL